MRIAFRLLLVGLASCALAGLVISWAVGSLMVQGKHAEVAPAAKPAHDFHLETDEGIILAATYWPGVRTNSPAVLVLHGVDASRGAVAANAKWLASLGYAVLTIDFRGHGQSSIAERSFGLNEAKDARTAFDWLKRRQHGALVGVIGISMGGAASLLGPAGPLPADALILQAVYPDIRHAIRDRIAARLTAGPAYFLEPLLSFQSLLRFGAWPSEISPLRAISAFDGPVMVIGGKHDQYTPAAETVALFNAAPAAKSLWLVPGADHVAASSLADACYHGRIKGFLAKTLGTP